MTTKDPRIDAYIGDSADFAKPILHHIRRLVHAACPDVEEAIKWGFPHFIYHGILCNMAAFKQHCAFGFWKRAMIFGENKPAGKAKDDAMGNFGRLTSISDLPPEKALLSYIREAVRLNETGIKAPAKAKPSERKGLRVPLDLVSALKKNKKASAAFEKFSYSHRKEYVEWITGAKRIETRQKRVKTAVEWMAGGKSRNWKYDKC